MATVCHETVAGEEDFFSLVANTSVVQEGAVGLFDLAQTFLYLSLKEARLGGIRC